MTQYGVTNPQPSDSPLNLMYKGVFSTRLSMKNKSQYGHYLDKLYQVQFLGIGSHMATKFHDLVNAVMLRQSSIDNKVELYKATSDRYNESVVLEALGGNRVVVDYFAVDGMLSAEQVMAAEELVDIIMQGVSAEVELVRDEIVASRIEKLKSGDDNSALFDALSSQEESIINTMKEMSKTFIGLVEDDVRKNVAEKILSGLNDMSSDMDGIKAVVFKKLANADAELIAAYRFNVRVAETLANVLVSKADKGIETGAEELASEVNPVKAAILQLNETPATLLRKGTVIGEIAYLVEKSGREALKNALPELAKLSDRQVAIAHHIMFTENTDYLESAEWAIETSIESTLVSPEYVLDTIIAMSRDLVNEAKNHSDYVVAKSTLLNSEVSDSGSLRFSKMARQAGEQIGAQQYEATRGIKRAHIDFEHEVKAEDSKGFTALLDTLYNDFVRMSKYGTTDSDLVIGGDTVGNDALIVEHLLGIPQVHNNTVVHSDNYFGERAPHSADLEVHDHQGGLWSDTPVFVRDSREKELFGALSSEEPTLVFDREQELFGLLYNLKDAAVMDSVKMGELTSEHLPLVPEIHEQLWGALTSEERPVAFYPEWDISGELTNERTKLDHDLYIETFGTRIPSDKVGFDRKEYEIAVLGCADPNLKYRRRPDLEPDKEPEDPLFEWICTEGYVCDDWLIVPLKDFNFENPEQETFFDPVTYEPYFPTGQYDEDGDPFVLPPYSILNEPISNGADVGGKEPMSIDPCNLYSFIEYTVKIYDAYKGRFHASSPIDTMSRVMNMLYEQTVKLVGEWNDSKGYTPDELWRIYRFIRWMALGMTNRFYRVKVEYTYGDFVENFEAFPYAKLITADGAARKLVSGEGYVMEGHPIVDTIKNKAALDFTLPLKTRSSTLSFEMTNVIPDRPDELTEGGVTFYEDFEGVPNDFKLRGDGWVAATNQSGKGLAVQDPAQARTYRTSKFNVPAKAINPRLSFNYGIDTNMDTKLTLKRADGTSVWESNGNTSFALTSLNPLAAGDYYFETKVPQSESSNLTNLSFTASQIQNSWKKVGYPTEWKVVGDTIYEDENTQGVAMVVNPQWARDDEYEMEVEFSTEDIPANYSLIDWLGVVLNYKDENNYYLFGTWSALDYSAYGGLLKVVNGDMTSNISYPPWEISPDFRFKLSHWHKLKAVVTGNHFVVYIDGVKYLDVTDNSGWGFGASGLAALSNPKSSFRNFKYRGKPRFNAFVDNVKVVSPTIYVPVEKPKYAIDFYLDGTSPRITDYTSEGKHAYSFPIMVGDHKASWTFKKVGTQRSLPQDASFIDNIIVRGMKIVGADVKEEFISCGGHLAVKLLIENLLEYYRRHHQGCKGERNIWIIE